MSKRKTRTRCLVIDASIAHAAGGFTSGDPRGISCRDFLIAVRGICHRMAWSEAIKGEWQAEESAFARQWRLSMINLNKLRPVSGEASPELRERIGRYSEDQNVVAIMIKDAHLIEAAIATDRLIASLDQSARGHFRRLAAAFNPLRRIIWVNPSIERERAVDWLESGAPDQSHRRLIP